MIFVWFVDDSNCVVICKYHTCGILNKESKLGLLYVLIWGFIELMCLLSVWARTWWVQGILRNMRATQAWAQIQVLSPFTRLHLLHKTCNAWDFLISDKRKSSSFYIYIISINRKMMLTIDLSMNVMKFFTKPLFDFYFLGNDFL